MKLASISNPKEAMVAVNYAREHGFNIIEIQGVSEIPELSRTLQDCVEYAIKQGCVEICIKEIRQRYDFMLDATKWQISIFGFVPQD